MGLLGWVLFACLFGLYVYMYVCLFVVVVFMWFGFFKNYLSFCFVGFMGVLREKFLEFSCGHIQHIYMYLYLYTERNRSVFHRLESNSNRRRISL